MLAYRFLENDRNIVKVEMAKIEEVDDLYEIRYTAKLTIEVLRNKVLSCDNKNVSDADKKECLRVVHCKYYNRIVHEAVVVGKVFDNNKLIGLKAYDLYTLEYKFVMENEYEQFFKKYQVRNSTILRGSILSKESNFTKYNKDGHIIEHGLHSDSEIISKYLDEDIETVIEMVCDKLVNKGVKDPYSKEANLIAEYYYSEIENMNTDLQKISDNLNINVSSLDKVKDYIFYETYTINEWYSSFKPSFSIAQSWQRLFTSKEDIKSHDRVLINHVVHELTLINNGVSRVEAHKEACEKYNYEQEATKYYDSIN